MELVKKTAGHDCVNVLYEVLMLLNFCLVFDVCTVKKFDFLTVARGRSGAATV